MTTQFICVGHHIAPNRQNLLGQRFNMLVVVSESGKDSNRGIKYLCQCDCGQQKVISGQALKHGQKSCGCLLRVKPIGVNANGYIHELSDTPTFRSWACMIQRCTNPRNPKFDRYGGRGISVCEEWRTFSNFLKDMGERPANYTIERINNDGNYQKSNCEWIPKEKQARNKSNNRRISFNGETHTVAEWSEIRAIPFTALRMRLHRGWSVERTLSTPV